jgi:hypothetical protein
VNDLLDLHGQDPDVTRALPVAGTLLALLLLLLRTPSEAETELGLVAVAKLRRGRLAYASEGA